MKKIYLIFTLLVLTVLISIPKVYAYNTDTKISSDGEQGIIQLSPTSFEVSASTPITLPLATNIYSQYVFLEVNELMRTNTTYALIFDTSIAIQLTKQIYYSPSLIPSVEDIVNSGSYSFGRANNYIIFKYTTGSTISLYFYGEAINSTVFQYDLKEFFENNGDKFAVYYDTRYNNDSANVMARFDTFYSDTMTAYTNGYNAGYNIGYQNGYNDRNSTVGNDISEAYDNGYNLGFDNGYSEGILADYSAWDDIMQGFFGPFEILNLELLPGFKIGYVFAFFMIIGVLTFLIGKRKV